MSRAPHSSRREGGSSCAPERALRPADATGRHLRSRDRGLRLGGRAFARGSDAIQMASRPTRRRIGLPGGFQQPSLPSSCETVTQAHQDRVQRSRLKINLLAERIAVTPGVRFGRRLWRARDGKRGRPGTCRGCCDGERRGTARAHQRDGTPAREARLVLSSHGQAPARRSRRQRVSTRTAACNLLKIGAKGWPTSMVARRCRA